MLKDLTSESLVSLQMNAENWEDAIRLAAKPLLQEGKIKQSYIERMIDNVKESGPYIVIAPHVALPHSRPDTDVLESAIGIATLKNPVSFGSEANDPVKYVFCLCAKEKNGHLNALADLANLLEKDTFYNLLDEARSPKEIIEFLKK